MSAGTQRDRDSRSKWAMPRYGYGSIKRSDSTEGGGAARRDAAREHNQPSCGSQVKCRRERERPLYGQKNCRYDCLCKLFKISGVKVVTHLLRSPFRENRHVGDYF